MPSWDIILVLAVMAAAVVLFFTEKLRVDVTAVSVLAALLILGLIRPEQALYGFANQATAIVAAMFVLSAGLVRTGMVDWLARHLDRIAGRSKTQLLVVLCISIALLSTVIINTALVAIFLPVAFALSKSRKIPVSKILIPMAFASQLGGVCTLIGASSNILVNAIAVDNQLPGFSLFAFTPLGAILLAVGIGYLILFSGRLLPKRKGTFQQIDKYRLSDYLAEFTVKPGSKLIGQKWENLDDKDIAGIQLIELIRGEKAVWHPGRTVIRESDVLLAHGDADKLMKFKDHFGLLTHADIKIDDKKISSEDMRLIEALVPPRSQMVGRTLRGFDFSRRFRCTVLAIQRRERILRKRLQDIRFDAGDTLLLQCDHKDIERIMHSSDLVMTEELTELQLRKDRALYALGIMALILGLAALDIIPILTAALLGALGMILAGCLTPEEAYQSIDWKVIFLLGGILPLGLALQQTGAAAWLADSLLKPITDLGPLAALAALYFLTAVLTEGMSNAGAVILLAPIALSIGANLEVSPRPLLIAITFAAATSFSTPIGFQTNTMIYGPGGYRFFDFTRVGVPLNILFWIISVLVIPILWPF